jgi:hypothetical protein
MPDNGNRAPVNHRMPWNKAKLIGARPPLRPKHVWSIASRLRCRCDQGRGCCPKRLYDGPCNGTAEEDGTASEVRADGSNRQAVDCYLKAAGKKPGEFLFTGRRGFGQCITTRQYSRLL